MALVPWLAALDRLESLPGSLVSAWILSVAFAAAVFGWFAQAITAFTGMPLAGAWLVLLVAAPLLEPQLFAFVAARHVARRRAALGAAGVALVGAGAWVGAEWAVPKLLGDTLGHGLYPAPRIRQAADLAGVGGLTFALLLANEAALGSLRGAARGGRALRGGGPRLAALLPAAGLCALVLGLEGYGALRLHQLREHGQAAPRITAGIVQGDIGRYRELKERLGTFETVQHVLATHFELTDRLTARGDVDLVVWPESVYPTTFGAPKSPSGRDFDAAIAGFAKELGVPLVFGTYDAEGAQEYNAAVFLAPDGRGRVTARTYRKASLFPLTERVPAILDSTRVRRLLPWLGGWKAGRGARVVEVALAPGRTLRVAPLICYDAVTPRLARRAVRRGAELIVTLSNDSWFDAGGAGPRLHHVVSAFRTIETRRPQVRATNTGISGIVGPTGEILARGDLHQRTTLAAAVPIAPGPASLVLRWGDWLRPVALGAGALLLAAARLRPSRARRARRGRREPLELPPDGFAEELAGGRKG